MIVFEKKKFLLTIMFTIVNEGSSLTIVNEGYETTKFLKTVVFEKKQSLEELKLLDIFLKTTQ